jgi:hypothetical protein
VLEDTGPERVVGQGDEAAAKVAGRGEPER